MGGCFSHFARPLWDLRERPLWIGRFKSLASRIMWLFCLRNRFFDKKTRRMMMAIIRRRNIPMKREYLRFINIYWFVRVCYLRGIL